MAFALLFLNCDDNPSRRLKQYRWRFCLQRVSRDQIVGEFPLLYESDPQ
ncbi:hypothetical protein [Aureimonas glaciei]|nr:hypothetical protein [Aureimonas glaciei]